MKTVLLALLLTLSLGGIPEVAANPVAGEDATIRANRVREFVAESPTSVLVREGRTLYRRVTTQEACPSLQNAERLAFQIGTALYSLDTPGRDVAVTKGGNSLRVSSNTPHATLVTVAGDHRVACAIARIEAIDLEAFNAMKAVNGSRDNRWSGDQR